MNMKQPVEPSEDDCCNSGCSPCVFDVYNKQLQLYEKFLKDGENSENCQENFISQLHYADFILNKKINLSSSHILLGFRAFNNIKSVKVWWNPGDHFLLKYCKGKPCSRAYTPIKIDKYNSDCDFFILVKRYHEGIVSNYLFSLNIGDHTSWRGPYGSFHLNGFYNRIIMIAQGTGIAPLYSIIKMVLSDEDNYTRLVLLYCCQGEESILLRDELYGFKSFWNFTYSVFIPKVKLSAVKYQEPIIMHRLGSTDLKALKPFQQSDQFLLCGSKDFMNCYKTLLYNNEKILEPNIICF